MTYLLNGFKPVQSDHAMRVKLINHGSLLALTQGKGTRTDWDFICAALNMAAVLADHGLGTDYLNEIKAAMEAHAQCGKRHLNGHNFGYTGQQLTAANLALEVHDAQIDAATVAQMERAHIEVAKRIQNKHFQHRVKELA